MERLTPNRIRILKTINLYCCFILLGMCFAVPGPCLLDLQNLVQTDIQHMAFIYTARSLAFLSGSIIGGVLLDAIKSKQALLTILNFFVASSILAVPWSRNLSTLTGFIVVGGISLGAINTGCNVVCLTLWRGKSGPFFQALHFMFGVGGLVAPLIAAPFLGDYREESYVSMGANNATFLGNITNFTTFSGSNKNISENGIPNIIYPFSIIGGIGLLVTLMFLAICIVSPIEEKAARNESSTNAKDSFRFIFIVVFLNFLLLFVSTGTEIGYAQMLTTYVVKSKLQLSASTGSFMTSAFWAAFTISRFLSVFLAIKVSNFTLIVWDIIIALFGSLVLFFLAYYEWAIWLASVLLGVGIASFFPAVMAWMDTYINVTNKIASVFSVAAAFGEMAIPFAISYFIDTEPNVLIYVVPTSCIFCTLMVVILYLIFRKREKKNVSAETTSL